MWCCAAIAAEAVDAASLYREGKFREAASAWEAQVAVQWEANAFHNLGNAHYRLGQLGTAALAYERALLVQPWHPEAAANLRFVREKNGVIPFQPTWLEKAVRFSTFPASAWVSIGIGWVGMVMGFAGIGERRRKGLIVAGILIVLTSGGLLFSVRTLEQRAVRDAVIVVERAEAKTEPAAQGGLAATLAAASRVRILSVPGDWAFVELPGGGRGWLKVGEMQRIIPEPHP